MNGIKKIKCPACNSNFIPTTYYFTKETFFTKNRVSGFPDYFKIEQKMQKEEQWPPEVILGSWITYCTNCNYILRFLGKVSKRKVEYQDVNIRGIRYEEETLGVPVKTYSDLLSEIEEKLWIKITSFLESTKISEWRDISSTVKDDFKFLVRFISLLEEYSDIKLGTNQEKNMPTKIKELELPLELEQRLIQINSLRNDAVHKGHELSSSDNELIQKSYEELIKYLAETQLKPFVGDYLKEWKELIDVKDLYPRLNYQIKKFFNPSLKGIDLL